MKLLSFLTAALLGVHFAQGQNDTLRLKAQIKIGPYGVGSTGAQYFEDPPPNGYYQRTLKELSGVPGDWKKYYREDIWHDYNQFVYQNFLRGRIDTGLYKTAGKRFGRDLTEYCTEQEIQCFSTLIARKTAENKVEYILDTDGDFDLADEEVRMPLDTFDYENYQAQIDVAQWMHFETWTGTEVRRDSLPFLAMVFSGSYGEGLLYNSPFYAEVTLGTDTVIINSSNPDFQYFSLQRPEHIDHPAKVKLSDRYEKGSRLMLDGNWYTIEDFEVRKQELVLTEVGKQDTVYPAVGFYAPDFSLPNLIDSSSFNLKDYQGKYVLLDFWGSWCQPCVSQIPDLVKMHSKLKPEDFEIVSVAVDSRAENVRKLINKHGMNWIHAFANEEVRQLYSIQAYPTYFLIDPKGKIVGRDLMKDEVVELVKRSTSG